MWWTRQGFLITPLNRIPQQPGGIRASSKFWAPALCPPASSRGPLPLSLQLWLGLPLPITPRRLRQAQLPLWETWWQRQRTQQSKFLGRNVLGCGLETGGLSRKAEQVEISWYKHGKLILLVVHVWNDANHMNGNYSSIVKKSDVKGLSKYPRFSEVISIGKKSWLPSSLRVNICPNFLGRFWFYACCPKITINATPLHSQKYLKSWNNKC